MKYTLLVLLVLKIIFLKEVCVSKSPAFFGPCVGSKLITWLASASEDLNQYTLVIKTFVPAKSFIKVTFDSEATVKLTNTSVIVPRVSNERTNESVFEFETVADVKHFAVMVKGLAKNVPNLQSLVINSKEYCETPVVGHLNDLHDQRTKIRIKREKKKKKKTEKKKTEKKRDPSCGRRKHLDYTELIVNGATSKPGDWPWHAAIYRRARRHKNQKSYVCGGTLVSEYLILTAAHCVTINRVAVSPSTLNVVLGKYNFEENDTSSQEINVFAVKVHEGFGWPAYLDNDIAILQLSSEAVYNNYVQPACIWYKKAKHKLPTEEIYGTVAGWGFDRQKNLAPQLKQITMPKIKRSDCIQKKPAFYGVMLRNGKKFCAGWGNGTSPCNGDSGGGFMVFVPDEAKDASSTGAWYIRGIVSMAASFKDEAVCDPEQYVLFTNILKYKDWIELHMH